MLSTILCLLRVATYSRRRSSLVDAQAWKIRAGPISFTEAGGKSCPSVRLLVTLEIDSLVCRPCCADWTTDYLETLVARQRAIGSRYYERPRCRATRNNGRHVCTADYAKTRGGSAIEGDAGCSGQCLAENLHCA